MYYDYSHGMEIEQDPDQAPRDVVQGDDWHRDGSGPQETDYGAYNQVKSILNAFKDDCDGSTWTWHNETTGGAGCGSHVHLNVGSDFDDELQAWTITHNTVIELAPFMLPLFCADWTNGYRDSVARWASPTTTRYSQDTLQSMVSNPRSQSRSYDAVTMNGADYSGKPLTLELRMNEAHPARAIVGLLFLRRVAGRCVEKGWSPKLAGDRSRVIAEIYDAAYDANDPIEALRDAGSIEFEDGRGIPGVGEEFDNALEVLRAILGSMGTDHGNYKDRVKAFTMARIDGRHESGPEDLGREAWRVDEGSRFWSMVDDRRWDEV